MVPRIFRLSRGTGCGNPEIWGPNGLGGVGDHLSRGTKCDGDRLSRGTKFWGTIYPGGPEVGDWKSGDQMGSEQNKLQPVRSDTFCAPFIQKILQN